MLAPLGGKQAAATEHESRDDSSSDTDSGSASDDESSSGGRNAAPSGSVWAASLTGRILLASLALGDGLAPLA
jgi:hypothetical protein